MELTNVQVAVLAAALASPTGDMGHTSSDVTRRAEGILLWMDQQIGRRDKGIR